MKLYNYDEAIKYLESKGISCDVCQDDSAELVNDLLDELYEDDSEYPQSCLDEIINIVNTSKQSLV